MSRHKQFVCFMLTYFVNAIYSNVIFNDLSFRKDECKDICGDNFFLLPLVNDATVICQRGCRLFNIIDAKGDLNVNKSKNDCFSSCTEAYLSPDFEACKLGCNEMQKKRESDLSKGFVLYIEQEGQSNLMVVQPDIDQVDLDILADPGLRGQLDVGYSVEYKIPETHIRTMPINDGSNYGIPPDMTLKQYQPAGDWLDCASRNSGIPRWILISAILLAILLGIWLIFASEKREPLHSPDHGPDIMSTDTDALVCNIESFPVPPPKYSLESETV